MKRRAIASTLLLSLSIASSIWAKDRSAPGGRPDIQQTTPARSPSTAERRVLLDYRTGLDSETRARAEVGLRLFNTDFAFDLPGVRRRSGLGPLFNSRSCESCHNNMGRGRLPATDSTAPFSLVLQLSRLDATGQVLGPDPVYGVNLNPQAAPGLPPEAQVTLSWERLTGYYSDGTAYELRRPRFDVNSLGYGPWASGTVASPRLAQAVIAVGLVESIPEAELLAQADPEDRDGDGISGRVNWIVDAVGEHRIGRFGWKASQPSIRAQTVAAAHAEMGLTSSQHPAPNCGARQDACVLAAGSAGRPELDDTDVDALVAFQRALAPPRRRTERNESAALGERVFTSIGCASCHRPMWPIGHATAPDAIKEQQMAPYSDFLLHDMGEELADGRPDGSATGREWRTAPLWGLGYTAHVSGGVSLLHDGRARSAEEAVLWHGGEAEASRQRFKDLSMQDRAALLVFLDTL